MRRHRHKKDAGASCVASNYFRVSILILDFASTKSLYRIDTDRSKYFLIPLDTRNILRVKSRLTKCNYIKASNTMTNAKDEIIELLVKNIPQSLIIGIRDGIFTASERAYKQAKIKHEGHRSYALGMERHLELNEVFHEVFEANGCSPVKLSSNKIVEAQSGIFKIAKETSNASTRKKLFNSKRKQQLIADNQHIETIIQPDLFSKPTSIPKATLFIMCHYSGSLTQSPDAPIKIELVVPSSDGNCWIFQEEINTFLVHYEPKIHQIDNAMSKLKKRITKKDGSEDSEK